MNNRDITGRPGFPLGPDAPDPLESSPEPAGPGGPGGPGRPGGPRRTCFRQDNSTAYCCSNSNDQILYAMAIEIPSN